MVVPINWDLHLSAVAFKMAPGISTVHESSSIFLSLVAREVFRGVGYLVSLFPRETIQKLSLAILYPYHCKARVLSHRLENLWIKNN